MRYIYEANIAAFLNSLHAVLDSFPYLLNLFIPVVENPDSSRVSWHENFINKYQGMSFYDELMDFMLDRTFHKVKGYVNTIKHKHLIRVSNKWDHLEFEEYIYKQPYRTDQGTLIFQQEVVESEDVFSFIEQCHNKLIPKLFNLLNILLHFKSSQLASEI